MDIETRNAAQGQTGSASNIVRLFDNNRFEDTKPQAKVQVLRIADDPVMKRSVRRIHKQGERMMIEMLSAIAEKHMLGTAIENEIKRFALMPPDALRAIGCERSKHFSPYEVQYD